MSEEQKIKDLCKTCEYYWEDFPLPLEYVVSHCDKIDEKYGLSKNMDDFVPYPCVKCPFDSYKNAINIIKRFMKVFCCINQWSYGGGLILVAADTKEEAYLTAANNDKTSYLFDWADDDYMWCEPDGNIRHCKSDEYPFDCWFEVEHLSTDLTEPQIIIEDHYSE